MTVACPTYEADPSFQLVASAGATGRYDCTAHSASNAIDHATCGAKDPTGRSIRLATNEPIPDPRSPGLNLGQVANVALSRHGVYLEVRTGSRAAPWTELEQRRVGGAGVIYQVSYRPIAATMFDAFGSRFFGGHAMFGSAHADYDPGADGRRAGIWKHDGRVYPRDLMKRATGSLVIGTNADGSLRTVGYGRAWCAFTRDVIPDYRVAVPGSAFFRYFVTNGVITGRKAFDNRRFSARCTVPLSRAWPKVGRRYTLVRITDRRSAYFDWYISAQFAQEI